MRGVLISVFLVALAAACGGVGSPAEQDDSCAGDPTGKLVAESRAFTDWWSLAWTPANELWFAAAEASGNQTAAMAAATIAAHRMAKVRGDAGSQEDMH